MVHYLRKFWIGVALVTMGLLACESIPSEGRSTVPFIAEGQPTTLEGLDRGTKNKSKKDLVTPYGVKRVYDPHQDPAIRIVFKELFEIRQQSPYFDKWPRRLIKRSQHQSGYNFPRPSAQWGPIYGHSDLLRSARRAQLYDYKRSGCGRPQHLRCLLTPQYYGPMCPSDTLWGTSQLSDCERAARPDVIDDPLPQWPLPKYALCSFEGELPPIARSSVSRYGKKNPRFGTSLPFRTRHIGDPKRGTMQQQFDQYFAIHCPKFYDLQESGDPKPWRKW